MPRLPLIQEGRSSTAQAVGTGLPRCQKHTDEAGGVHGAEEWVSVQDLTNSFPEKPRTVEYWGWRDL